MKQCDARFTTFGTVERKRAHVAELLADEPLHGEGEVRNRLRSRVVLPQSEQAATGDDGMVGEMEQGAQRLLVARQLARAIIGIELYCAAEEARRCSRGSRDQLSKLASGRAKPQESAE